MFDIRRIWIAVGLALALFLPTAHAVNARQDRPAPTIDHVVRPGDTLWRLAEAAGFQGDRRDAVATILELNDGISPALRPGQIIKLPAR